MLHCISTIVTVLCTAAASLPPAHAVTSPDPPSSSPLSPPRQAEQRIGLPTKFQWSSSEALVGPKSNDGRNVLGIKDPSIVEVNGTYHVFASAAHASGYSLVYLQFNDFTAANASAFHYLEDTATIGPGYRAAPQVFYFAPQGLWYLVFQTGDNAAYSTTSAGDIGDPDSWSAPKTFYGSAGMPAIVRQHIGSGYWVDMWVVCDAADCYLFSSDDNGHLYRSRTAVADFPGGMTDTVIALADSDKNRLFEASNVYKIADEDSYLLIVEAIGSDGQRYFRSWTSSAIAGPWTPLADTEANPFARANNVAFSSGGETAAWTKSISHGEMIRDQVDQTMTISPCNLRYLYQGLDPSAGGNYNSLPWRLGLLTQTNSAC